MQETLEYVPVAGTPWQVDAACRGATPLLFTSDAVTAKRARPNLQPGGRYEQAARICAGCPVFDQCRAWAEADTSFEGIAAGRLYRARNNHLLDGYDTPRPSWSLAQLLAVRPR